MARMRAWIIRGGEGGRSVDAFVADGIIGLGYPEVGDVHRLDRWDLERTLEDAGYRPPDVHADTLVAFANAVVSGDPVVMPDPSRGEVVVGVVSGAYDCASYLAEDEHRHRRKVTWLARHAKADLPVVLSDVQRQRVPLRRVDSPSIEAYLASVRAGEIGRPADQTTAPRAPRAARTAGSSSRSAGSSPSRRSSAPPAPRKAVVATRRCDGCFQTKPVTQFEADDPLCRDCA